MKISNVIFILIVSFLLKIHLYVFTFIECFSRAGVDSFEDFFKLFNSDGNMLNFFIGVAVNLAIIYYTLKLKTVILKKILTAPIVVKMIKLLRDTALFLYHRYYRKTI